MKILFVVQNYYPSVGGTQIFFQNLAENLANDFADDVEVYTTNSYFGPDKKQFKKILKTEEIINNVTIKRFNFFRFHLFFLKIISKTFKVFFNKTSEAVNSYMSGPWSPALTTAIKKTKAEVIFAGTSNYLYMLYPLYRNKIQNKKPFVFQGAIHFAEEDKKVLSKLALEAIKKSEFYISNTDYEKQRLVQLGVDEKKVITGGSCIDIQLFNKGKRDIYRQKLSLQPLDILIGYIGRIEFTKNIEVLLKAFNLCFNSNKNINLVIGGYQNADYITKLKLLINDFDKELQTRIFFETDLSLEQKINLFNALDIFVSSSENESFGMVFLEAWACKKPVIGTSIGAIKSVVENETDGLLFVPGDYEDLEKKILRLANDEMLRDKMGNNGYRKTLENYTLDAVAKKYRDVFIKAKQNFYVH